MLPFFPSKANKEGETKKIYLYAIPQKTHKQILYYCNNPSNNGSPTAKTEYK